MDEKKTAEEAANKTEQISKKEEEKKQPTEIEKKPAATGNKDPNTICGEICFTPKKNGADQSPLNAEPSEELKAAMLSFLSNNDALKNLANPENSQNSNGKPVFNINIQMPTAEMCAALNNASKKNPNQNAEVCDEPKHANSKPSNPNDACDPCEMLKNIQKMCLDNDKASNALPANQQVDCIPPAQTVRMQAPMPEMCAPTPPIQSLMQAPMQAQMVPPMPEPAAMPNPVCTTNCVPSAQKSSHKANQDQCPVHPAAMCVPNIGCVECLASGSSSGSHSNVQVFTSESSGSSHCAPGSSGAHKSSRSQKCADQCPKHPGAMCVPQVGCVQCIASGASSSSRSSGGGSSSDVKVYSSSGSSNVKVYKF